MSAAGGIYCHPDRETPDTFRMMAEYPSNYTATLFATQTTQQGVDLAIWGEKGTIRFEKHSGASTRIVLTPKPAHASPAERRVTEVEQ